MIQKIDLRIDRKQPKQEGIMEPLRSGIKDYLEIAPQAPKKIFPGGLNVSGKRQDAL